MADCGVWGCVPCPGPVSLSFAIPSPIQGSIPQLASGCGGDRTSLLFGSRWFKAGTKAGPWGSIAVF